MLNRLLRMIGARWQNLSREDGRGTWPRHGRAWLHRSYGLEWVLFRWRCGVSIESREQGRELTLHAAPIIASFFLTLPCPRWFARLLPLHHYTYQGKAGSYPEDREISVSIHGGRLWWTVWREPMGEWSRSVPRWRDGSFGPVDFLLGRARCETTTGKPEPALVPMPEGSYAATITREDRVWRRPRWPFVRRRTDYSIEIPQGIPFEGKGENSWDCGTDALFGTGGNSPENAIANAVASVTKSRKRYGTPREIREAPIHMAPRVVLALLLCALALPALAAAQAPLAPGMQTHWCSDRLCSGAGTARITRTVPAAPCDPWADGLFQPTNPLDLACFRQRYDYPHSAAPGSWIGAWCGQHSPCDSISTQWSTTDPRQWTWGGGCLEPGSLGRAACDAIHTAGATLGCTMLPCGVVSCPAAVRTCEVAGDCGAGWRCTPLVDLPAAERPPAATLRRYAGSAASEACSWHDGRGRTWVRQVAACFAGLPADCQTVATLRSECWSPPEPEPPVEPPAPTAPVIDVELLGCDGTRWKIRASHRGGDPWTLSAAPGDPAELSIDGETVLRFSPAAPCSAKCPAAETLGRVRAEVCEP